MTENLKLEELKSRFSPDKLKRVKKELLLLYSSVSEDFPLISLVLLPEKKYGLFIKLDYNLKQINTTDIENSIITVKIQLDSRFPFKSSPRVYIKALPGKSEAICNDGRDYLEDIIKQSWNSSIFLVDIIRNLPGFLNEIIKSTDTLVHFLTFGRYKPDTYYSLSQFKSNLCLFEQAFELVIIRLKDNTSTYSLEPRLFILTPLFLLSFERMEENLLKLTTAKPLVLLISVTLKRYSDESVSSSLVLKWVNEELQILCFNSEDLTRFIDNLGLGGQKLKKTKYVKPIKFSDVSTGIYKDLNRHELEGSIMILEQCLKHGCDGEKEEIKKILDLVELYRKAVEFFSAIGDQEFEVYLKKLNEFLLREEVQLALKGQKNKV